MEIHALKRFVLTALIHIDGYDSAQAQTAIENSTVSELNNYRYAKISAGQMNADGTIRTASAPSTEKQSKPTMQDVARAKAEGDRQLEELRDEYQQRTETLRANREADRLEFRRQQDEAAIPARREAILRARQAITDAQSVLRSFTLNEAVFALIIRELGTDVTAWTLQQALDSNAISLPAPSEAEQKQWAEQDEIKRRRRLLDMRPDQLKAEIRKEAAQRRQHVEQAEAARVQKLQQQTDSYLGYPELPEFNDKGEKLDSLFFRRAPAATIRRYAQRYGIANLNKRIMGR